MRYWAMLGCAVGMGALSFGQAVNVSNNQGAGIEKNFRLDYSRRLERTITGTVAGKVKGAPRDGTPESMAIVVKAHDGHTYSVELGPTWFVAQQATEIKIGDKVRVIGELVTARNTASDTDKFMLARQIIKGRRILALRDSTGYPYWNAFRTGRVAITGANNSLTGTIVSQTMVNAENQQQMGLQLRTNNGLVNVAVAPNWYLEQQGLGFHMGDQITVYTGMGPAQFGDHVIIADGLYGYGGTVTLRPGGVPVWQGWTGY